MNKKKKKKFVDISGNNAENFKIMKNKNLILI